MTPEIAVLEDRVAALAYLHAELAWKHTELVQELQVLISQAMNIDPARAQMIRTRATKIARLRNKT